MRGSTSQSRETGSVSGLVAIAGEGPAVEATVMIAGASPRHHDLAALTGRDGSYRFTDLAPGEYTLVVNAAGRGATSATVRVTAGAEISQDIMLGPEAGD